MKIKIHIVIHKMISITWKVVRELGLVKAHFQNALVPPTL